MGGRARAHLETTGGIGGPATAAAGEDGGDRDEVR